MFLAALSLENAVEAQDKWGLWFRELQVEILGLERHFAVSLFLVKVVCSTSSS